MTVKDRATGWLTPETAGTMVRVLLHAAIRYRFVVPAYCFLPDHFHALCLGTSAQSDQLRASEFFRKYTSPLLHPQRWQRQAHDRVLREESRDRGALLSAAFYVLANPIRAGWTEALGEWPYAGVLVPGYPDLDPQAPHFPTTFWKAVAGFREGFKG